MTHKVGYEEWINRIKSNQVWSEKYLKVAMALRKVAATATPTETKTQRMKKLSGYSGLKKTYVFEALGGMIKDGLLTKDQERSLPVKKFASIKD